MLRKIILPLVLLIFTQQDFYGTEEGETVDHEMLGLQNEKNQSKIWMSINNWVNVDDTKKKGNKYPKLWLLWAIVDNVPFQYGGSKIWKYCEAYYGLSNGIGFFFSFLNFGWLKIGIGDAHINIINLILDSFKNYIQCKTEVEKEILVEFDILYILLAPIFINLLFNFHIFSVKILNCIKIKLLAPLTLPFVSYGNNHSVIGTKEYSTAWYITYNRDGQISWWYALLSPRIEINIAGIIDYFKGR